MARYGLLATVLLVAYLPGLLVGDLIANGPNISKASSFSSTANDLYTESPCELRPLSAWKDPQGNVWGVGDGNLWWFNATNLSWSLLPLPNGTASDDWRVTCGDPRKYVALQGSSGTLVLHLPWQHWQPADTDDVRGGMVDANASWCSSSLLYAADPGREVLYQLDHEEARWVVQSVVAEVDDDANGTAVSGMVKTWLGPERQLVIAERHESCRHVMSTNASGAPWTVLAKDADHRTATWPDFDLSDGGLALTWRQESGKLWLWQNRHLASEMWSFDMSAALWERAGSGFASRLPLLTSVLTSWVDKDTAKFCVLERSAVCTALYSVSHTTCWSEGDVETATQPLTPTTMSTVVATRPNTTVASRVISPPSTAGSREHHSAASSFSKPTAIRHHTTTTAQNSWRASGGDDVISILPARNTPWHQHTSVFGSVIFFGTSLTIFGLVGFFWCVRRCVHFPKEALLLRDPPSVRYTAIPDSLGYDSRKPTPATYTVIPDSIA